MYFTAPRTRHLLISKVETSHERQKFQICCNFSAKKASKFRIIGHLGTDIFHSKRSIIRNAFPCHDVIMGCWLSPALLEKVSPDRQSSGVCQYNASCIGAIEVFPIFSHCHIRISFVFTTWRCCVFLNIRLLVTFRNSQKFVGTTPPPPPPLTLVNSIKILFISQSRRLLSTSGIQIRGEPNNISRPFEMCPAASTQLFTACRCFNSKKYYKNIMIPSARYTSLPSLESLPW